MAWKPMSTKDVARDEPHKVLLYSHHGFGKTFQVRNFAKRYGKGLLLSGEAGLKSLADVDVDYFPFSSWDGRHDPDAGVYSFRGLVSMILSAEFRAQGYSWIAIDSITELSERLYEWCEKEIEREAASTGKAPNGFKLWDLYGGKMISTLKWIRDLKMHVYVSSLAAEAGDVDAKDFWPLVKGAKIARQIPAIFDHVFCGLRTADIDPSSGATKTKRFIVSEQVNGWHGKVRDPYHRIAAVEDCDDITDLLERMTMSPDEWEKRTRAIEELKTTGLAIAATTTTGNAPV